MHVQVLFSHAEATALLPTVREVFARVRPLHERLVEEASRLSQLGVDPFRLRPVGPEGLSEELARRRQELHELARRIDDELAELSSLGVEVKGADGLADFRSLHDGRVVFLCWRWDEDAIAWWHDLDAGFAGRQPIEDPAQFAGDEPQ
jgi:hypothetical protein